MSESSQNTEVCYTLEHASKRQEESARLDSVHEGITAYFRGKLTLANLHNSSPKIILEMGAGSGAWAIQAAITYPDAQVLAVDLAEMPTRWLPSNVKFIRADLTEPFSFEPKGFDIVHSRLTLMHVPNFENVLQRTIKLVNPGGWLFLEDPDIRMRDDQESCPSLKMFIGSWISLMERLDVNIVAVTNYERILKDSDAFSEITVHKFGIPLSGKSTDPLLGDFGETWRSTLNRTTPHVAAMLANHGFEKEAGLTAEVLAEMNGLNKNLRQDMYCIWARKRV